MFECVADCGLNRICTACLVSSTRMNSKSLFGFLEAVNERPAAFSKYTAGDLWADGHTSAQMLAYHLNEDIDLSSRNGRFIDESVRWMMEHFKLSEGCKIVDFGCGPGLYSSRLAQQHADVVGIDFSSRSIGYAREFARKNDLDITYVEADYLEFQPDGEFDLIIMIMWDFCALAPAQRARMLSKFYELLADGGRIVLDAYSLAEFANKEEEFYYEKNLLNGFWSDVPYYAFVSSFKYEAESASLDKYTIIEEDRLREVYNWLQYFTPETLRQEALSTGLNIDELYGDVTGKPYDPESTEFAVVLRRSE